MTDEGLYGDRLAKLFPMIRDPNSGLVKSLQKGTFAAVRMAYSGPVGDPTLPSPPDEAFALCLRLRHQRAETWLDGRYAPKGALKDETSIYDLRCETIVHFYDPFDFLYLYLPHNALSELANELEVGRVQYEVASGANFLDPIVVHLGRCLLPALERPQEANELFVGHVAIFARRQFRLNGSLVVSVLDLFQVRQRTFDGAQLIGRHLAAVFLQRRARAVHQLVGLVARSHQLAESLVVFLVGLGVRHHALNLFLGQTRTRLDLDLLLLAGLLVLG